MLDARMETRTKARRLRLCAGARRATAIEVTVLDYGGNLGDYYWVGRALVPGVKLEYHLQGAGANRSGRERDLTPEAIWHTDDTLSRRTDTTW